MEEYESLFQELFESCPEIKDTYEQDKKWRLKLQEQYKKEGMIENDAKLKAWDEYWKMARDRDGVEFEINKIK